MHQASKIILYKIRTSGESPVSLTCSNVHHVQECRQMDL